MTPYLYSVDLRVLSTPINPKEPTVTLWEREPNGKPFATPDAARAFARKLVVEHRAHEALVAALHKALPLLIMLGDYVGNKHQRCETILEVRNALDLLYDETTL